MKLKLQVCVMTVMQQTLLLNSFITWLQRKKSTNEDVFHQRSYFYNDNSSYVDVLCNTKRIKLRENLEVKYR